MSLNTTVLEDIQSLTKTQIAVWAIVIGIIGMFIGEIVFPESNILMLLLGGMLVPVLLALGVSKK